MNEAPDQISGDSPTSRRLKIMHISDNFLPTLGGLERAVNALATSWAADGHSVTVVCARNPNAPDNEDRENGVKIRRLPMTMQRIPHAYVEESRVFFPPMRDPEFTKRFKQLLDEEKPDIAHIHGWVLYSVIDALSKKKVPVVTTAHDYGQVCALKTLQQPDGTLCSGPSQTKCPKCAFTNYGIKGVPLAIGLRAKSKKHRLVTIPTAISRAVAEAGSAVKVHDRQHMQIIPSYVSEKLMELAKKSTKPEWAPEGDYIFYAGALGSHKGVDTLLNAYSILRERGFTLPLLLAGMPRPHEAINLNSPGVIQVANKPHEEIMGAWRFARLGVIPSKWKEPLGQTAVEGLASGVPLVVANHGGLLDVIDDGKYALTFEPGNAQELAEKMQLLLTDKDLARRLSESGPLRASHFLLDEIKPKLLATYFEAIAINDAKRDRND